MKASSQATVTEVYKNDEVELLERSTPVVNAHNEWDPLEEVIVGVPHNTTVPPLTMELKASIQDKNWAWFKENEGQLFPQEVVNEAIKETDYLCHVLEQEGVTVRRPDIIDHSQVI